MVKGVALACSSMVALVCAAFFFWDVVKSYAEPPLDSTLTFFSLTL